MIADFKKKQKNNPSKQLALLFFALVLCVFFFFLVMDSIRLYKKRIDLASQVENLQQKIQDIERKNDALRQGMNKDQDDAYIERVAREELDLQQPGEKVFSFVVPESQKPEVANHSKGSFLQISNWWQWVRRWLHF